jgi:hypothetical protein
MNIVASRLLIAGIAAIMLCPAPAIAWTEKGHQVIAGIAARNLTEAAKTQVEDLLDSGNIERSMMAAANWAHEIESKRLDTRAWHFTPIPVGEAAPTPDATEEVTVTDGEAPAPETAAEAPPAAQDGYVAARDCPDGNCSIARINADMKRVVDPSLSKEQRAEALKYLINLMGDIHQPLRCGTDGSNHGRDTQVLLGKEETDLFTLWDDRVVEALGGNADQIVSRLATTISRENRRLWARGSAKLWCEESAKIANNFAYNDLRGAATEGGRVMLHEEYPYAKAKPTKEQLQKAGLRLAALLNFVFK